MISYKAIGKRIRDRRKMLGLTQLELSVDIDVSTAYLCNVELGNKCVSLEMLIRIANGLDTTVDSLLSDCIYSHLTTSISDISSILADCTLYESRVIIDTIKQLKNSMRSHEFVKNPYNE